MIFPVILADTFIRKWKQEQLECLRSRDTLHCAMITRTIESYWIPCQNKTKSNLQSLKNLPKVQILRFWNKPYLRSSLIKCVIMKWRVLLKIQSGHDSVHSRTDRHMDRWTRWSHYTPIKTSWNGGIMSKNTKLSYLWEANIGHL